MKRAMDVKCPSCETEYELDEGRMKPAGVTVKCANCEHVFRVRRRGNTSVGGKSEEQTARMATVSSEEEVRTWLVRLLDGEIKVCRELATLQRWIVSGIVTKECEISRTGKKWKVLDELNELSTFFAIAQEAHSRTVPTENAALGDDAVTMEREPNGKAGTAIPERTQAAPSSRYVVPRTSLGSTSKESKKHGKREVDDAPKTIELGPPDLSELTEVTRVVSVEAMKSAANDSKHEPTAEGAQEAINNAELIFDKDLPTPTAGLEYERTVHSSVSPEPTPKKTADTGQRQSRATSIPPPAPGSEERKEPFLEQPTVKTVSDPGALGPSEKETVPSVILGDIASEEERWANVEEEVVKEKAERAGPTGGMAKSVPTAEAAFAGSQIKRTAAVSSSEFRDGHFVASDATGITHRVPSKRHTGRWVVGISLLVLAVAGVVIAIVLFSDTGKPQVVAERPQTIPSIDASTADSSVVNVPDVVETDSDKNDALFSRNERTEIEELLSEQEGLPDGFQKLLLLGRSYNALSQFELDKAQLNPKNKSKLYRESRKYARLGLTALNTAIGNNEKESEKERALCLLAKANSLRLTGTSSREVQRWIRRASEMDSSLEEAKYVTAMLHIRDRRKRDARAILEVLLRSQASIRYQHRLACLSVAEGKKEEAQELLKKGLAMVGGEHQGMRALLDVLEEETNGKTASISNRDTTIGNDSLRPKDKPDHKPESGSVDNYEKLLIKADKAAESGNCRQAVSLYEKALGKKPSGVAALTGLGYCHLDFKNYSSAQSRFRAALGISPRYQDALWGVAEGYQQQGLTEQAIKGYRRFIKKHPESRRSDMAKRQIERLGGSVTATPSEKDVTSPDSAEEVVIEPEPSQ